jgi:hypothetical protein
MPTLLKKHFARLETQTLIQPQKPPTNLIIFQTVAAALVDFSSHILRQGAHASSHGHARNTQRPVIGSFKNPE